jgi:septation ring formation regulator
MELFELLNTTNSWIYLGVALIVISAGIFWLYRNANRASRYSKQISNLETRLLDVKTIPIAPRLSKLAAIGENNVVFASVYQEYSKTYQETIDLYTKDISDELDDAKLKIKNKETFKISPIIKGLSIKIDSFRDRVLQIEDQLKEIMKDDDETRTYESKIKDLVTETKSLLNQYEVEIEVCSAEFDVEFKKVEEQLALYSDTVKTGAYNEAKELLKRVEKEVNVIKTNLVNNHSIIGDISIRIPNRLNELIDVYNDMQNSGYPLYHISGLATINSVKESVLNAIEFLKVFNFENMDEVIKHLSGKLDTLENSLTHEKQARVNFEANYKQSYDRAEALEREHIKHIKEVSELEKYYVLDDKIVEKTKVIKKAITELSSARRILDNLVIGNQAYSSRLDKLNEMMAQVIIVDQGIVDFKASVRRLSDISDKAYTLLSDAAYKLKNAQFKLRETRHNRLYEKFIENFNYIYNLIEKLGEQIAKMPMDIGKIDGYTNEINQHLSTIIVEVDDAISNFNKARKLIMYANAFRSSFTDVQRNLNKAEALYFEANFVQAIDLTLQATSRFSIPESLLAEFNILTPDKGVD